MFADPTSLALGAATGLVFGFLLQKGGVTRFQVIVGQFLLKDFTVLKVMLTAIVVGAIGIYGMRAAGMDVPLHVKGTALLANVLGGLIFGVGMAILGYCPGTALAAIGDGS
ncbi:MAG: YeeE/YedE thiosulfate transporter family protein, partial [Planctomycetota bacterium]